jgi:hypothetical protein
VLFADPWNQTPGSWFIVRHLWLSSAVEVPTLDDQARRPAQFAMDSWNVIDASPVPE